LRVLLARDPDNPASGRAIRRNGGELEKEVFLDERGRAVQYYRIRL
jgi:predicted acetyltransferase